MKNVVINFNNKKAAFKDAAAIIKGGFEHYPRVHALENSILEVYSLKTGANLKNLKRSARAIRLTADIDWRSIFYCSLITQIIGEDVSPKLYDKVVPDLILINSKGDFKKVSEMDKIIVKGEEYAILSKEKGQPCLLMKMNDPYWYGSVIVYHYCPEKGFARKIAHLPTSMVEGF